MTVSALVTRNDITATASQTSFTYTFRVLEATDMDVYQNGALLASGYTVNDVGVTTGGTVTLDVGVPVGQIVSLVLAMPLDRTTNYQNSGDFLAGDVNGDFDKIYIGAIQNENEGGRSLRLQDVEPPTAGVDMTIPLKADRLGKFLAFDDVTGGPIVSSGTGADAYDSAAWSAYNFTGNGSTTAFVLGISPHSENNTQVYIDGVYQQKDGYSLSASTITFSVAPPNLSTIEVMVTATLAVGSTSSDLVSYTPAGTGAVATTVQTKLRESVSVKDFGAVGDGTTDDTAAIKLAMQYSASTGVEVFIPAGTYNFNGNSIDNGGLLPTQDIGAMRLRGVKGASIFKNGGWIHLSSFVSCVGVTFEDFIQPIYMTGSMSDIQISECTFIGCTRAIIHNDTTVGVSISRGLITNNVFKDVLKDEVVSGVYLRVAPTVNNVYVTYNTFTNIKAVSTGTAYVICCYLGDASAGTVDKYTNNHFDFNTVINCGNSSSTFAAVSYGAIVAGLNNTENNNVLTDNYWLDPLYAKGNGNSQNFNKCHDNQFSGISMKVYDTTIASKENLQVGNVISGQCDKRAGVRMFGSGISIDSQVDITTTAQVDTQGGFGFQATRSTSIAGRLQVGGNFVSPKGIQINTAGDVSVDVRLISGAEGIAISESTDGLLGNVVVRGKIKCEVGEALRVDEAMEIDIQNLQVISNSSAGYAIFLLGNNQINLSNVSLRMTDSASSGTAVSSIVGIFTGANSTLSYCLIDILNFNFYTERNFTQLIMFNDGTAPAVGSSIAKMQINGSSIEMNGKTGSYLLRSLTNFKNISLASVEVLGSLTRTLDGGGKTFDELIINNCLTNYVSADNVAGHTNATVTASRIVNNLTA
jgi:uncharacterized membrane protein